MTEDKKSMTDISMTDEAAHWAARLEAKEQARTGLSLAIARKAVARRLKVSPGALENLRRGRTKGVRAWIYETLRAEVVRELESEQGRIAHELEVARARGFGARNGEIGEIEAGLSALKILISEGKQ